MKKIFIIMLCAMLMFALPIVAFANEGETVPTEEAVPSEEIVTEEASITETIVEYVKSHIEEISVIATLLVTILYEIRKHGKLTGSIGTLNNNAIAIAENGATAVKAALTEVADIAKVVEGYKEEFSTLLSEMRHSLEEKQSLETTLSHVETFLKTAKLATLELSNEVAELLVLANIPNSKKDELYARHTKAVHELEVVEEVMSNDGKEA